MRNYYDIFIRVAPDCPVSEAVVPNSKRGEKSVPQVEYELLAESPYTFTQEEWAARRTAMPKIPSRPALDLSGKWIGELPSLPEDYLA